MRRRRAVADPLQDVTLADRTAVGGVAFRLRFRPRLGVLVGAGGAGSGAARVRWKVVPNVNNVFGRAELRKDTTCCVYMGETASLEACTRLGEARRAVSSVTWHGGGSAGGPWARTCYGIVDGTWQPVKVEPGQAHADSARQTGARALGPAPELTTPWVNDR